MPSAEEYRDVALATLIPGSVSVVGVGAMMMNKDVIDWWKSVPQPDWAPKDIKVYSAIDLLTMSPLGCASYLVYKDGGGFAHEDTKLALAAYGGLIATMFLSIPGAVRKDLKWVGATSVAGTALGALTAASFYRINKHAGLMMVPLTLWLGFYSVVSYQTVKLNQ